MLTKEAVSKAMQSLPEQFTIDELYTKLDLLFHIDQGIKDIEARKIHSHESVVNEFEEKWKKSSGQKKH